MNLVDDSGFIQRGGHRVSLRILSERRRTHSECSDEMRQRCIDMALLDPPLCNVDGDEIFITEAGRRALSGYQGGN